MERFLLVLIYLFSMSAGKLDGDECMTGNNPVGKKGINMGNTCYAACNDQYKCSGTAQTCKIVDITKIENRANDRHGLFCMVSTTWAWVKGDTFGANISIQDADGDGLTCFLAKDGASCNLKDTVFGGKCVAGNCYGNCGLSSFCWLFYQRCWNAERLKADGTYEVVAEGICGGIWSEFRANAFSFNHYQFKRSIYGVDGTACTSLDGTTGILLGVHCYSPCKSDHTCTGNTCRRITITSDKSHPNVVEGTGEYCMASRVFSFLKGDTVGSHIKIEDLEAFTCFFEKDGTKCGLSSLGAGGMCIAGNCYGECGDTSPCYSPLQRCYKVNANGKQVSEGICGMPTSSLRANLFTFTKYEFIKHPSSYDGAVCHSWTDKLFDTGDYMGINLGNTCYSPCGKDNKCVGNFCYHVVVDQRNDESIYRDGHFCITSSSLSWLSGNTYGEHIHTTQAEGFTCFFAEDNSACSGLLTIGSGVCISSNCFGECGTRAGGVDKGGCYYPHQRCYEVTKDGKKINDGICGGIHTELRANLLTTHKYTMKKNAEYRDGAPCDNIWDTIRGDTSVKGIVMGNTCYAPCKKDMTCTINTCRKVEITKVEGESLDVSGYFCMTSRIISWLAGDTFGSNIQITNVEDHICWFADDMSQCGLTTIGIGGYCISGNCYAECSSEKTCAFFYQRCYVVTKHLHSNSDKNLTADKKITGICGAVFSEFRANALSFNKYTFTRTRLVGIL